jgi:DNA-binding transcriptional MerR regulator
VLIGEVAKRSGISSRMLRHYDRIGVVSPSERTPGGYRHYTDDDLRRLFLAEGLRSLGMSLKETAEVLDGPDFVPLSLVARLVERSRERIALERELLGVLEQVQTSAPRDWSDILRTVGLLHGLEANSPSARQQLILSTSWTEGRDVPLLVEAALRETNPTVAGTLYWALAGSGDAAVPALRDALDSPVAERRHRAVEALEKINTPLATEALAGGLGHTDLLVRRRATLAAGRRGQVDAIPPLVALIVEGADDTEAAGVLGELATSFDLAEQIDRALAEALEHGQPDERLRLVAALTEIPSPQSLERLAGLAADDDRRVALAAQAALGHGSKPNPERGHRHS